MRRVPRNIITETPGRTRDNLSLIWRLLAFYLESMLFGINKVQ